MTAPTATPYGTRMVIGFVGALALVALLGVIALAATGSPIPDVLQNVAVGSLTGLVGLLVPTFGQARP